MRHLKRISFFIYTCLIFAAGFYGHIRVSEFFYPGRQPVRQIEIQEQTEDIEEPEAVAVSQPSAGHIPAQQQEKVYRAPEPFFLVLEQNLVVVYEADRSSLYQRTAIDGRTLPSEIRHALLHGMIIDSKSELEKFLVSYSA